MDLKPIGQDGYVDNLCYAKYPTDPLEIRWCEFCHWCATKDGSLVCLNSKLWDLVWNGPKIVNCFGSCEVFTHKRSEKAKELEFPCFKKKLLESTGVYFSR